MSSLTGFVKRIRDIMWNDAGVNGDAQRIEQMAWILFLKVYNTKEEEWQYTDRPYTSIIPEECRWNNWAADDKSGKAMTGDTLLDFVNNKLFPTLKGLNVTAATPIKKAIVKTTFEDANNYMKDGVLLRQVINIIDDLDLDDYEESHAFGEIYESILRELQSAGSSGEFYTPRAVTDFMAKTIKPKLGEKVADFACGTGGFLTSWLNELSKQVVTAEDQQEYATSIFGIEKKPFPYTSSETADLFMSVIMYRLKQNGRAAVILPDGFLFGTDNAKIAIKEKLLSEFNLHTIIRMPHSVFAPYTSITTNILFFDRTHPTTETWFYRLDMPEGYKNFSKTKPMKLEHFAPAVEWWDNREEITIGGFDKAKKYSVEELKARNYNIDLCGYPHEEEEILPPKELILQYQEKRASLNADIDRILAQITDILGIDITEEAAE